MDLLLAARDDGCSYDGNSDLYGVGVRVGLYAQWVATLLATVFEPRSENGLRTTNLIIQLAVFIGLCTESTRATSTTGLHASAAVITQFLLCGSLSSVTGDGISHLRTLSGAARLFFYTAFSAYGCWFWFVGVDVMRDDGGGCAEVAFFARTSFDGWFRVLGKVLAALGLVVCAGLVVYWAYLIVTRYRTGFESGLAANADRYAGGKGGRPRIELALLVLSAGLLVLSAMVVEYLIRANGVQKVGHADLDSVGQLIPLIAGCTGAALMLWRIVTHRLFLKKRCLFLFGFHL
ncbi:hypothetical protein A9K55_004412 [Cordyceps militaris]|nr:hypothetical protein A9K55_004412 [Cordyceps militaris]